MGKDVIQVNMLGRPGIVATGYPTGLAESRGEDWQVPCDRRPGQTFDEWVEDNKASFPPASYGATLLDLLRKAWDDSKTVHIARLRRVGWLDQKGVVWDAIPSGLEYNGGSYTPLLIDPGER